MAYYFNSSKIQDLGVLHIKHVYQIIYATLTYTPCWVGDGCWGTTRQIENLCTSSDEDWYAQDVEE